MQENTDVKRACENLIGTVVESPIHPTGVVSLHNSAARHGHGCERKCRLIVVGDGLRGSIENCQSARSPASKKSIADPRKGAMITGE
jgi:hypothetical protein